MTSKLITRPKIDDGLDLYFEESSQNGAQPFDLSELDKLPQPTEDDPAYHSWWVVDNF